MSERAARRNVRESVRRFASLLAVALAFVVAQTLVLAHANSHEAAAPGHNKQACALHLNGDRPASAIAPDAIRIDAPVFVVFVQVALKTVNGLAKPPAEFYVRGPPTFA